MFEELARHRQRLRLVRRTGPIRPSATVCSAASSFTDLVGDRVQGRLVVDGRDRDRERLIRARVDAAVGGAAVVVDPDRHVAEPFASGADVYVNVPVGLTAGWVVNSALLSLLTMKSTRLAGLVRRALRDQASPTASRVCAPASSSTVWSPPFVKLGASLTAVTVIVNV